MSKERRGNGSGSILRTSEGWRAQVRIYDELTGKSRQIRRRAKSRDEARQLLAAMLDQTPVPATATGITLADYFATWSRVNLPLLGLAPNTARGYADNLRWYGIPAAGRLRLSALTATTAEQWLQRVAQHPKKPRARDGVSPGPISASTVRGTYVAAVKALDTAVRDGLIPSNPLRQVARPKVGKVHVPVTKPDEADRLLEACQGRRIEPLVIFVAFTGCRIGEALSLRWADVDLDGSSATIRRGSHTRDSTKTGRIRTVTLLPEVVEQLRAVKARQARERLALGDGWTDAGGLVFTSATGKALDRSNVTHELQRALKAAGVTPARPWHSLRHGLAHRLLARGVPLHTVSAILGHSGIAITADLYGHVDSRVPVDVLAEAMGR